MITRCIPVAVLLAAGCDSVFGLEKVGPQDAADAPIDAPIVIGWKATTAAYAHSCGIQADDTLWCWGGNDANEIGIASPQGTVIARTQLGGSQKFASMSSRYQHTCAIGVDQSLWCWGSNTYAALGTGNLNNAPTPQRIEGQWKQVSAGGYHTCAIRSDDTLWCWGWNIAYGEVGTGLAMQQPEPVQIGTATWIDIDTGWYHACGLQSDHSLWCWGANYYGIFGDAGSSSKTPRLISGESWNDIATGEIFGCGRTTSNAIRCWGYGDEGEIGNGAYDIQYTPVPVKVDEIEVEDWISVSTGDRHACGIRGDASLWCWGNNNRGQLAVATDVADKSAVPVRVTAGATQWRRVEAGSAHTCAIDIDNNLWCFGTDARNQLGDGGDVHPVPSQMPGTATVLAPGMHQTCIIDATGAASCAGYNAYGGLGDGTTASHATLASVGPPATAWSALAPGTNHGCGIANGVTYCWGYNGSKALGDGSDPATVLVRTTPGAISGSFQSLASADHTCGLSGQTVYCWGYNVLGQVGNNSQVDQGTPSIAVDTDADQVVVGYQHSCARRISTGGVVCWGRGYEGEIGNGVAANALVATAVDTSSTGPISTIAAGGYHTCAIATTGLLWCWGDNTNGELGIGDRNLRVVPTQVGTAQWRSVALGNHQTCGIQADGSLWCWGNNARGALGLGHFVDRYLPAHVGTDTDWVTVKAGFEQMCATKAGGQYWCWGSSDYGQIPDGTGWKSTPVMVP